LPYQTFQLVVDIGFEMAVRLRVESISGGD